MTILFSFVVNGSTGSHSPAVSAGKGGGDHLHLKRHTPKQPVFFLTGKNGHEGHSIIKYLWFILRSIESQAWRPTELFPRIAYGSHSKCHLCPGPANSLASLGLQGFADCPLRLLTEKESLLLVSCQKASSVVFPLTLWSQTAMKGHVAMSCIGNAYSECTPTDSYRNSGRRQQRVVRFILFPCDKSLS